MPHSRATLLLMAIVGGVILVVAGNLVADLVLDRIPFADGTLGFIDAPDVAVLDFVCTSLPMVVLALVGTRSRVLWLTALLLGITFWAYFIYQIWQDSLSGFAGGANIGLGLIALASPFFILVVLGLVALVGRVVSAAKTEEL